MVASVQEAFLHCVLRRPLGEKCAFRNVQQPRDATLQVQAHVHCVPQWAVHAHEAFLQSARPSIISGVTVLC
jgi:hypothetical protein